MKRTGPCQADRAGTHRVLISTRFAAPTLPAGPAGGFRRLERIVRSASRLLAVPLAVLIALTPVTAPLPYAAVETAFAAQAADDEGEVGAANGKSAIEAFYNAYGDRWATNRGPNPDIPTGLTPSCHRRGPNQGRTVRAADELTHLLKSSNEIMFEDCADIAEATEKGHNRILKTLGTFLKERRPELKYIGYLKGTIVLNKASSGEGPYPVGLREIEQMGREDWFVHVKGTDPTQRANRLKVAGDDRDQLYDVTNPAFRAFFARKIAESLEFHNMGGVGVDKCFKEPALPPAQLSQVDDAKRAAWGSGCIDLISQIRQHAAPLGKLVFFLGLTGRPLPGTTREVEDYQFLEQRLAVSDGFLWEDPMGFLNDTDLTPRPGGTLDRMNTVFNMAQKAGNKYVGIWVNTNGNNPGGSGQTTAAAERAYASYYLALYLQIFRGSKTPLLYLTPTPISPQFHSDTFFRSWNLRIGKPQGSLREIQRGAGGSVLRRVFQNGQAWVNNTGRVYVVNFGRLPAGRPLFTQDGVRVPCNPDCTFRMAPKSGMLFVGQAAREGPGPGPGPEPGPGPGPQPGPELGPQPEPEPQPDPVTPTPAGFSTVIVTKTGNGFGTVTSAPAGVNCGTDCHEHYQTGAVVTLTATASTGSRFDGWGGACTGTGPCTVTLDANKTVEARFSGLPRTVRGVVMNAVSGARVRNATVSVVGLGLTARTGASGVFVLRNVPVGTRTLRTSAAGLVTDTRLFLVSARSDPFISNALMPVRATGDISFVLTWASRPANLDAHLSGPAANGRGRAHVGPASLANPNAVPHAVLSANRRGGFGPETITIRRNAATRQFVAGVYRFWVHNASTTPEFRPSEARVAVIKGNRQLAEYHVSVARTNDPTLDLWHVVNLTVDREGRVTRLARVQELRGGSSVTVLEGATDEAADAEE